MAHIEDTWEGGNVATLNEAASSTPVPFNPQSLINHDAAVRPWNHLPSQFQRTVFDPECLVGYEAVTRSRLLEALRTQSTLTQPRKVEVQAEALESVFGRFTEGHAFLALNPDWGFRLHEPQATSGLAHLLNRGIGKPRVLRIRAFLEALGIPELPDDKTLQKAQVHSEVSRIDLEVRFPTINGGKRAVLVEAKFGHKLTPGQLRKYRRERLTYDRLDYRIVGLTPAAGEGRKGKQTQLWRVVLWRDLWRRFEQRRPYEEDGQLASFMAWLWARIGGLNPNNSKSR